MFQASLLGQDDHEQELDHRLANAETPPAVSNVELASSFIATMIGEQVLLISFIFVKQIYYARLGFPCFILQF